ncbi:hypothetical protein SUGI_0354860 [Cryptomeria japonica]|nr:hypothetical protein SUGI_0354860 [Cryptomeria japonica]
MDSRRLMERTCTHTDGFKDEKLWRKRDGLAHIHGINFDLPQVVQTAPSINYRYLNLLSRTSVCCCCT